MILYENVAKHEGLHLVHHHAIGRELIEQFFLKRGEKAFQPRIAIAMVKVVEVLGNAAVNQSPPEKSWCTGCHGQSGRWRHGSGSSPRRSAGVKILLKQVFRYHRKPVRPCQSFRAAFFLMRPALRISRGNHLPANSCANAYHGRTLTSSGFLRKTHHLLQYPVRLRSLRFSLYYFFRRCEYKTLYVFPSLLQIKHIPCWSKFIQFPGLSSSFVFNLMVSCFVRLPIYRSGSALLQVSE